MVTLKDIAKAANVSQTTVSRALNNDPGLRISESTREKIYKAVKEFNYIPNQIARNLVKGNLNSLPSSRDFIKIGCILDGGEDKYMDAYFSHILSGIQFVLDANKMLFSLVIIKSEMYGNPALFNSLKEMFSGVILIEDINPQIYSIIKSSIKNVVGIAISDDKIDNVTYDMQQAAEDAVKLLVEKGHRRIAFIGGSDSFTDFKREKRYKGYANILRDYGIAEDDSIVRDCKWDTMQSYRMMHDILEKNISNPPTALFAACDMTAVGAMRAIHEAGLSIPKDIAIISIDNIEMSMFTYPPLSTIDIPKFEMGEVAAQILISRIKGDDTIPKRITLPTSLIQRDSC